MTGLSAPRKGQGLQRITQRFHRMERSEKGKRGNREIHSAPVVCIAGGGFFVLDIAFIAIWWDVELFMCLSQKQPQSGGPWKEKLHGLIFSCCHPLRLNTFLSDHRHHLLQNMEVIVGHCITSWFGIVRKCKRHDHGGAHACSRNESWVPRYEKQTDARNAPFRQSAQEKVYEQSRRKK